MGLTICIPEDDDGDCDGASESDYLFVPDVDTYVGERNKRNERHGKGVYYYSNGDIYDGCWSSNKKHGQGEYRSRNGEVYIGWFEKDEFKGSIPPHNNSKQPGSKKTKKNYEKPAKPLDLNPDLTQNKSTKYNSKAEKRCTSRPLISPQSKLDSLTAEEKEAYLKKEQERRERSRIARENHRKTLDHMRQKYHGSKT